VETSRRIQKGKSGGLSGFAAPAKSADAGAWDGKV
jgi:hypothetical protein